MSAIQDDPQVQELIRVVVEGRRRLLATDPADDMGLPLMLRNAAFVDDALRRLYYLALVRTQASHGQHYQEGSTEIALVATGGYGRQELAPFSDIDLAFVPSHEENPFVDALLTQAFRLLVTVFLDSTDLEVGYGFRPLGDLPSLDHETLTSLLDSRLIVGSRNLFDRFQRELTGSIEVVPYLQHKAQEYLELAARSGQSVYSVSPDLKEGPGGLRDVQTALWMSQVKYGTLSRRETLERLVREGVVRDSECQALRDGEAYLRRVRTWLHLHAQRKQDVLLPELQAPLGRAFGYVSGDLTAGQLFMREHYRRATQIRRVAAKIRRQLLWARLSLPQGFQVLNGRLHRSRPRELREEPALAVTAYRLAQRYALEIHPVLDGLLENCIPLLPPSGDLPEWAATQFLEFLADSLANTTLLYEMRDRGLLHRLIPGVEAMMLLAPSDPAHEVTVGEHSLRVLDELAALGRVDEPRPLAADVFQQLEDLQILALGALLHDIGKGQGTGDHSLIGAQMAAVVADRLRLTGDRRETLVTLVREHLTLPRSSRLRSLDDPATLREVATAIPDRETLKLLYVLSYADTRAVGAQTYTQADLEMLGELYLRVNRLLAGQGREGDLHAQARQKREEVTRQLAASSVSDEAVERLCQALPPGYLLNTPLGELAARAAFLDQLAESGPVVDLYDRPAADFTELTLCAPDSPEPGLLSRLAGVLCAHGLDIHSAQVFTLGGDEPVVLDTLWVSYRGRQLPEATQRRVAEDLRRLGSGEATLADILTETGTELPSRVELHRLTASNTDSDLHTVIHVAAEDVPGLLHVLTGALSALAMDIHIAKITSWSGRAEDSFYVSDSTGAKLAEEQLEPVLDQLRAALTGQPDGQ